MSKLILHENIYSTSPQRGVFIAVPAGTELSHVEDGPSVKFFEFGNDNSTYHVNINSRKFKEHDDNVSTIGIEKTQGKFVGVFEKTSISTVEKYMEIHKDKVKYIKFFNVIKDILREVYKHNIVIDNSIVTLPQDKVTNLSLLDTTDRFNDIERNEREYIGLIADTAEYMDAYIGAIFKGKKRKIEFSSPLLAISLNTPILPTISATIKL